MDWTALANFALVLLFVLIGGVFAGTEMAIVNLRESQVKQLEESGARGESTARLVRDPNLFLSAVQIGVTVAGFFSSAYGASTIAPSLVPYLVDAGLSEATAGTVALIGMTLVVAFLSLVLGELVPKRLAMQNALAMTRIVGPPLSVFGKLMRPVIWLLSASTNLVVRILGGDPDADREAVSAEEIRSMVRSSDALDQAESRVLADVFDASERTVVEVMRPRPQVHFLDGDDTVAQVRGEIRATGYSRYPVTGEDVDDVLGFAHVRDMLLVDDPATTRLRDLARPIEHIPGTVEVLRALNRMRAQADQIAVVVDEYGGTDGIVTLEDLLEELVGEIYDEFDADAWSPGNPDRLAVPGGDIDGGLILQEFEAQTGISLPDTGGYETVGGYVMAQLGRIAEVGDEVPVDGGRIEVTAMDDRRVQTVHLIRDDAEGTDAEGGEADGPVATAGAGRPAEG
ncbi:hemolysin family protein [Brachybacterium muris]|uniref:hemolysin family protein n=1 Tax=Brachybacterium muris TaxID=219301 RepID=UPI00223AFB96|nr:hemolysin family protein [Brachybacterium muris]MCT1654810.1 hemolysin family protein [Brachybacterium muris]MCT1997297.1 hemolysin family protein [Brachybacterium muris]MCT2261796.1 hemolysin family protein [Brachybacterium muris]